jgi:TonB family protein
MIKSLVRVVLAAGLLIPAAGSAELIRIQVRVFQGFIAEGGAGFKEDAVLTASSHPALAALKAKVGGPESALSAAAGEALLDALELRTIDDLFAFAVDWDETASILNHRIVHLQGLFDFSIAPRRLSPQKIEVKFVVQKSESPTVDSGKAITDAAERRKAFRAVLKNPAEKFIEKTLVAEIGEPVVVGTLSGGKIWLFMLLPVPGADARPNPPSGIEVPALKVLHQVLPAYPDELRRQNIKGEVELQVLIDEEGLVAGTKVTKSLHPYLDYAAVQALLQWRYEPVVQNGKPVQALMTLSILFDPDLYRREEENARQSLPTVEDSGRSGGEKLAAVLEGCAAYCRKLSGAVLEFACEETIKEIRRAFTGMRRWAAVAVMPRGAPRGSSPTTSSYFPTFDPERTEKNDYLCDYMLVKNGERVEERRIILKENGKAKPDRDQTLDAKRFAVLSPLFVSLKLLDAERQSLFNYRIIDEERIRGRKAYVLEAMPKLGDSGGVSYARIWVDRTNFQILRSELKGVPLEGYEDVLRDSVQYNLRPDFIVTHDFRTEHNGVLFPSRSEIRILYPQSENLFGPKTQKMKADLMYDRYKFFTVETEPRIIK